MTMAQVDFDNFAPMMREWEEDGLYFITRRSRKHGILILAKKEPFKFGGCIYEPGKMWFKYTFSEEAGVVALKLEMDD